MSQFILDYGTPDAAVRYGKLDSFTQGYIEAMFFTSTGDSDDSERDMQHATLAELAEETWQEIERDCAAFQEANKATLEQAYAYPLIGYDAERAGNDFWYTRNGHGTGFWDRGLEDVGGKLSAMARDLELDFHRRHDGMLYLS